MCLHSKGTEIGCKGHKRIDAKLRNMVDVVAARGKVAISLLDEMEALEARKEELTAVLADADQSVPLLHPNMSEIYRKRLDRLDELLNRDSARGQAAEVLRSMIQSICLIPQDGALATEIGGNLAGLLAFTWTNESPAAGGASGACQFGLVAGPLCAPIHCLDGSLISSDLACFHLISPDIIGTGCGGLQPP